MIYNLTDEGTHKWCAVDVHPMSGFFAAFLALPGTDGPACHVLAFPWHGDNAD